jgi:hypothetical protein
MALWEDTFKNGASTGVVLGLGAVVLAPVLLPVVATVMKPMAKEAIKLGVMLYEKGSEAIAEVGEVIEDLLAEAKAEVAATQKEPSSAPVTPRGGSNG